MVAQNFPEGLDCFICHHQREKEGDNSLCCESVNRKCLENISVQLDGSERRNMNMLFNSHLENRSSTQSAPSLLKIEYFAVDLCQAFNLQHLLQTNGKKQTRVLNNTLFKVDDSIHHRSYATCIQPYIKVYGKNSKNL